MLSDDVREMNDFAFKHRDTINARDLALVVNANQRYAEYLDKLLDNVRVDASVTIQVDGKKIRFENDDAFREWMAEQVVEKVLA